MALTIGELVGFIRADDSGMRRGLDDAELRLRGFTRDVDGRLRHLDGRFASVSEQAALGFRRATDEGDHLTGSLRRIAGMAGGLARVALSGARIGAMLGTAIPVAAGLVTTLANIAPAAAVGVTAFLAFQQASVVVKLGMQGVGDAITAALDPSKAEEFNKALEGLSPEAKKFALAVRELAPAWKELQQEVQDELFRDLSKNFRGLAKSVLPGLRKELVKTAGALGDMAAGAMGAAKELADNGTLGKATKSARKGLENLSGVPGVFVKALGQIAAAAGPSFEKLTGYATDAAFKIGKKLDKAFESGAMEDAIEEAIELLGDLWDVGENVFEIIGNIFGAVPEGGGIVGVLEDVTQAIADLTGTDQVQQAFQALFETMGVLGETAAPLLADALGLIAPIITELAPPVQELIRQLGEGLQPILDEMKESGVLTELAAALGEVLLAVVPLLPPLGELIAAILPYLVPLIEDFTLGVQVLGEFIKRFAVPAIQILTDLLRGDFSSAMQGAKDLAADMVTSTVASFASLPRRSEGALAGTKAAVVGQVGTAGASMVYTVRRAIGDSIASFARTPSLAGSALRALAPTIGGQAERAGVRLLQAISQGVNSALIPLTRLVSRARGAVGDLSWALYNSGRSLIRGFIDGIVSMIGSVKDAASEVVGAVSDFFPHSPAKKGPFSGRGYTSFSGRALIRGFQEGIARQAPALERQLQGLTGGWQGEFALAGAPGAGAGGGSRTVNHNNTYNLTMREMTMQQFEALQRRQDTLTRMGRPY
ncbi:hypothetical protein [Streptomyces sp. AC512_CC834]|uniref:phage tail protein n=1 Tax=Streptomyces sp. AC512_CC834 TaxID=2823691 RepID=UPI001C27552C|nr:hypothetical protein [Streptomyces sp. AC512_CC834]